MVFKSGVKNIQAAGYNGACSLFIKIAWTIRVHLVLVHKTIFHMHPYSRPISVYYQGDATKHISVWRPVNM